MVAAELMLVAEITSLTVRLISPRILPRVRAISIDRFGPSARKVTKKMIAISVTPIPNRFKVNCYLGKDIGYGN